MEHIPVLYKEVMQALAPKNGDRVLDVTVGLGGHAKAFLEAIGPEGKFIGIDADEENLNIARKNLESWKGQVELWHGNFREFFVLTMSPFDTPRPCVIPSVPSEVAGCIEGRGRGTQGDTLSFLPYDILFADLGLSSPHVDDPSRGFTFREDAPLDMRFDRSKGETATEFLSRISEEELTRVFREYGELRSSRRLAEAVKRLTPHPDPLPRGEGKYSSGITTLDLKRVVEEVYGWRAPKILPQVFQALRIAVNDELGALQVLLREGPKLLKSGGRMGIISYHSLEDRMVKQAFRALCTPEKDPTTGAIIVEPPFVPLSKKPRVPSLEEVRLNPRSRSAKFRAIQKW